MLGMYSRFGFGLIFSAGYLMLVWDLLTLGHGETALVTQAAPAE